jgi:hypothetical protein
MPVRKWSSNHRCMSLTPGVLICSDRIALPDMLVGYHRSGWYQH